MPAKKKQNQVRGQTEKISISETKDQLLSSLNALEPRFKLVGENLHVIEKAAKYFVRRYKKGLFVNGNVGSGKTLLFEAAMNCGWPWHFFKMVNCQDVADSFEAFGTQGLSRYKKGLVKVENIVAPCENIVCFDDLGQEDDVPHYGVRVNVMERLVNRRYLLYRRQGTRTHFTTNLSWDQIEQRYGERIKSRLHEMCYVITLGGSVDSTDWRLENA